jgi:hypothetical protein
MLLYMMYLCTFERIYAPESHTGIGLLFETLEKLFSSRFLPRALRAHDGPLDNVFNLFLISRIGFYHSRTEGSQAQSVTVFGTDS